MCLEIVCESEGDESVSYCEEDSTCILQGMIVFMMGISILFDLGIEFICMDATPTQRNSRISFVSIVLLPAFWFLLAIMAVSSKSYYCTDMPCIAKHMLYPVLITLRNPGALFLILRNPGADHSSCQICGEHCSSLEVQWVSTIHVLPYCTHAWYGMVWYGLSTIHVLPYHTHTDSYRPIPTHTNSCQLISVHTNSYQLIPTHTSSYRLIPTHTNS